MEPLTRQKFSDLIEVSYDSGVPLAGSVGRAAVMGADISHLRPDGRPRDIDIVNVAQFQNSAAGLSETDYDCKWISRFLKDGYLIYPGQNSNSAVSPKVAVPFPEIESVFEPVIGQSVNGVPCITLRPEVQLAMDGLLGGVAPKNKDAVASLKKKVETIPRRHRLDPSLLEPIYEYSEQVSRLWRRRFYVGARLVYHATIPKNLKTSLHPYILTAGRGRLI